MKSNFGTLAFVAIFAALWFISCFGLNAADTARLELDDLDKAILAGAPEEAADPITLAQVTKATERTFPNLSEELDSQKLLQKTLLEPSMRGNLRGRLAEEDFLKRNAKEGWRVLKILRLLKTMFGGVSMASWKVVRLKFTTIGGNIGFPW